MISPIKLTIANRTDTDERPSIVFTQKNQITAVRDPLVAWKVVTNLGRGDYHPFEINHGFEMGARDYSGNQIGSPFAVEIAESYSVIESPSGIAIQLDGLGTVENGVQLVNRLNKGTVTAEAYKDGKLLAIQPRVNPNESAGLEFSQIFWVGVVPNAQQGQLLNGKQETLMNGRLNLRGVISTDIILTGGGNGPAARPYAFHLENVQKL